MARVRQIRYQFTLYFVLLIVLTVALFEGLLYLTANRYFYGALERQMTQQSDIWAKTIEKELESQRLSEILGNHAYLFSQGNAYEVQVYDREGSLLIDTSGEGRVGANQSAPKDVISSLNGINGFEKIHENTLRKSLAYSRGINLNGIPVGVIRTIAPIEPLEQQLYRLASHFIVIGVLVILITSGAAYKLADTVTTPILNLIRLTSKMAMGDYKVRAIPAYEDEIGELATSINQLADGIQKRDLQKNKMFSSVSHELRTPLTAIRGWAQTLNTEAYTQGNEDLKEGLDIIAEESFRLQRMVEALLDFSRMTAFEMDCQLERADLAICVEKALETIALKAEEKGVIVHWNKPETPVMVAFDFDRMKQLLINLIDNAIKFTPKGKQIWLYVILENDGQNAVIRVTDEGCGISQEDLPLVKERYFKGKGAGSYLGLGLAICDEIVKAHKGVWRIESQLGKGTQIEVCLPLEFRDAKD